MKRQILGYVATTVLSLGLLAADGVPTPAGPPASAVANAVTAAPAAIVSTPTSPAARAETPAPVAANAVTQPSASRPPLGLPRWLTIGGEVRGRMELDQGVGFSGTDNSYYLHRARLDVGIRLHDQVQFSFQIQDSRAPGWDTSPRAPTSVRNAADVRLMNLRVGDAGEGALELVAGRQALVFGSKRLVSTSNWGNVCPAFDGVRLTQHVGNLRVHYLAAAQVRSLDDGLDRFSSATKLFGAYASWQSRDGRTVIEPYWLATTFQGRVNELGVRGGEQVHTFGTRLARQGDTGMDYEAEILTQTGDLAGAPVSAWGAHANVGRRFADWRWTPRFFVDYSFASGDGDRTDGRQHTLQQLFPTHKWGTADNLAWRNIHEPVAGVQLEPHRRWRGTLQFRELFLASRQDGLYSFSGSELVRNPAATSSHIGHELDFHINYRFSSRLDLLGGYGRLFKGEYLRQSRPEHGVNVAFLMWTYKM